MSILIEETRDHVRYLRLNRPEQKNALNANLGWAIVNAVHDAHADDDVRVIAITGEGRAFSSGLDLAGPADDPPETRLTPQEQALDEKDWVGRFLHALRFDTDKPVVIGVNGVALGAGLALAMAGDIRIAADTARLHPGYLRVGTSPDGGLSWTLPLLIGHERAMRFLLESRFVLADEALSVGLVGEVVAASELPGRLEEYCSLLASHAPLAVRQTKRLVTTAPLVSDLDRLTTDEVRTVIACLGSADGREAITAMLEGRPPVFEGR